MRILAVDPGSQRLGIAISDPTGTIASPLTVIKHVSRAEDAAIVIRLASDHQVEIIIVGQSLDDNGHPTLEGRRAGRFAEALGSLTNIPVILWDETLTTADARSACIAMGVAPRKRSGHLDDLAATILLQSYLNTQDQNR